MPARYPDAIGTGLIREFTGTLAEIVAEHDPATPVKTCGDWSLADLACHVYEVQYFWAHIIDTRPAGPDGYEPPKRLDDAELASQLSATANRLADSLDQAAPDDPAWSWSAEQTVAFSIRRQTHEAQVHLVDGLLACGQGLPQFDAHLGADGVDEMLTHMIGAMPPWATFVPSDESFVLEASDTADSWSMRIGRLQGTEPNSGQDLDAWAVVTGTDPTLPATTTPPLATVSADSVELGLWLWGRLPDNSVSVTGDQAIPTALRGYVALATQ